MSSIELDKHRRQVRNLPPFGRRIFAVPTGRPQQYTLRYTYSQLCALLNLQQAPLAKNESFQLERSSFRLVEQLVPELGVGVGPPLRSLAVVEGETHPKKKRESVPRYLKEESVSL